MSLRKTLYPLLSYGSTREKGNRPDMIENLLTGTYSINTNKTIMVAGRKIQSCKTIVPFIQSQLFKLISDFGYSDTGSDQI